MKKICKATELFCGQNKDFLLEVEDFPAGQCSLSVRFFYSDELEEWVLKWGLGHNKKFTNCELKELVKISDKLNKK